MFGVGLETILSSSFNPLLTITISSLPSLGEYVITCLTSFPSTFLNTNSSLSPLKIASLGISIGFLSKLTDA